MADLTDEQIEAVQELAFDLCYDLAERGVNCVVVMNGRGCDRTAYFTGAPAAGMLASALKSAQARNVKAAN